MTEQPNFWTAKKPTKPGVYGVRGFNLGRPKSDQFEAIVSVRPYKGELICNLHQSTTDEDFDTWFFVDDLDGKFEWLRFEAAPHD